MDDVIKYLNEVLPEVANIDVKPIKGFDGDAWVWIWHTHIGEGTNRHNAEIILRVQPDAFYERVSTEVSGRAWKEMKHDASWSITYGVEVLEIKDFRAQAEKLLRPQLGQLLSTAWMETQRQANRLNILQERREKLQDELRRRKLMDA